MKPLFFAAFVLFVAATARAETLPGPVVNADWLVDNRDQVVVLDVRKDVKSYTAKGHIPGAVLVNWKGVTSDRVVDDVELQKILPDPSSFEALMRNHGVNNDTQIVIAHPGETAYQVARAARLYWQLKYYGHDGVALLDGGTAAWQAAGQPLSQEVTPQPDKGDFRVSAERDEILATTADVEAAVKDGTPQLVDNRPQSFFLGLDQRDYVYARGHIPGSINVPYTLNTRMKSPATFRPATQLRQAYEALGVKTDQPVIAYCNSGAVSAASWFVLSEIFGNETAKLYDGSMHEWTKDKDRPVVPMRVD